MGQIGLCVDMASVWDDLMKHAARVLDRLAGTPMARALEDEFRDVLGTVGVQVTVGDEPWRVSVSEKNCRVTTSRGRWDRAISRLTRSVRDYMRDPKEGLMIQTAVALAFEDAMDDLGLAPYFAC